MKKTMLMHITLLALATALIAAPMTAQKADPAELQLKAAIQKEVEDGDLKGAIALYSKLAESPNRAVAAKALVQMGQCYDKLGDTEARKAYERVVRDFADQKEALAAAQKRLAERAGPSAPGVTLQRIATFTGQTDVYAREINATISRNGRYFVFAKDDGVYLQDLTTSTAKRIVRKSSPQESFMTAIFPDGRQVVYVRNVGQGTANSLGELYIIGADGSNPRLVFAGKQGEILMLLAVSADGRQVAYLLGKMDGDSGRGDFYVVDADGSTPRRLYSGEKGEFPLSTIYSPDGKQLLVWALGEGADGNSRLLLISVGEGSSRVIGPGTGYGQFSPDGRYISYYRWGNPNSGFQGGIYMAPTEGGKPVLLAGGEASDPRWTPDGTRIIFRDQRPDQSPRRTFFSNAQEPCDLYSIRVADGKPGGKPELMIKDVLLPAKLLGPMPDGSFYFSRAGQALANVYTVDLDPATGKAVSKPARLNQTFIDSSVGPPKWSPDGQWLAYSKLNFMNSSKTLMIRSSATGEEHEVSVSPPWNSTQWLDNVQWFPDNRSLLALDRVKGRFVFRKVDVQTGQQQLFFEPPGSEASGDRAALSLDGKVIFFSLSKTGANSPADAKTPPLKTLSLMRHNMESGEEKELYQANSKSTAFGGLTLSSDGRQLAFTLVNSDNTVSCITISVDGGAPREIYRSELMKWPSCWMKDGRHVLVGLPDFKSGIDRVWTVPTEGGQPVPTGITFPFIGNAALHPDGRRFTFAGRQPGPVELWVMKLLPPGPKP